MPRNVTDAIADNLVNNQTLDGGPISEIKISETAGAHDLYVNVPAIHGPPDISTVQKTQETFVLVEAGTFEYFRHLDGGITSVNLYRATADETPNYRIETMVGSYES